VLASRDLLHEDTAGPGKMHSLFGETIAGVFCGKVERCAEKSDLKDMSRFRHNPAGVDVHQSHCKRLAIADRRA
jgi:hypothetical protein